MSGWIMIGFMALALFGMPIAFALGFTALIAVLASGIDLSMIPQRMMHSVNSFPLMAIPLFMVAGELMIKAGIVERLIELANSIVGRVRGGLAHVTMIAGAGLAEVLGFGVGVGSNVAIGSSFSNRSKISSESFCFSSPSFGRSNISEKSETSPSSTATDFCQEE